MSRNEMKDWIVMMLAGGTFILAEALGVVEEIV